MKRFLVIEDNGQDPEAAVRLLREEGFTATLHAGNGELREETEQGANEPYRDIIENAPVGIFRSTLDGRFISVNPAVARILKYDSPQDLIETVNRSSIAEVLYPEPGRRQEVVEDLMLHKGWQVYEVQYRCKDGSIITCNDYIRRVPGPDGGEWELEGFVEDVTDSKKAEDALRLSQFIIDKASIGILRGQEDGKIRYVNEFGARMLGYSQEELCSMYFFDIDPALNENSWKNHRRQLIADGSRKFEAVHRRKDGTTFPVEVTVNYMEFGDKAFSCSFAQDITERKRAEEALRESEEIFRVLAETSPTAIFLYQGEMIIYANPATERLFGYTADELLRMRFWDWAHEDFKEIVRSSGLARQRGESVPCEYESRFVTKNGEDRWLVVSAGLIEYKGRPAGVASFLDITENKKVEGQLRNSLAEKEVLLKEVHHRVKNNMQIISTLLDLQSETIIDEEALRAFRESQDRIRAMALVHEKLYQSADFSSIDLGEYIEKLANVLFNSYMADSERITLKVDVRHIPLEIDKAIPCGLIINELLSNALKHAFPDGRKGEISIRFDVEEDDRITLTVADNGVGMPEGVDPAHSRTLGLQLVSMLARQLRGEISLELTAGTVFTIRFWRSRPI